jgi:exonuclease SbcD
MSAPKGCVRFLHCSDLHIGNKQFDMETRESDFEASLGQIARIAKEQEVDAVLLAGDVFDSFEVTPRSVKAVTDFVSSLSLENSIPVYGVDGNHESRRHKKQAGSWLDICVIMHVPGVWRTEIKKIQKRKTAGQPLQLSVVFMDWHPSTEIKEHLKGMAASEEAAPDVLVMHQSCAEFMPEVSRPKAEVCVEDLKGLARYVAIGDIHVCRQIKVGEGEQIVASSGSTEMNAVSEPAEKFVFIVDMEPGIGIKKVNQIQIPTRKVVSVVVSAVEGSVELAMADVLAHKESNPLVSVKCAPPAKARLEVAIESLKAQGITMIRTVPDVDYQTSLEQAEENIESSASDNMVQAIEQLIPDRPERCQVCKDIWASPDKTVEILSKYKERIQA